MPENCCHPINTVNVKGTQDQRIPGAVGQSVMQIHPEIYCIVLSVKIKTLIL